MSQNTEQVLNTSDRKDSIPKLRLELLNEEEST